ncbi:Zinc finger MYND-type [Penicillium brevicompactum]|uniref:Zinc finger MYND-type n=1 Tax=Penicillium brevicompactum TaxID=5074 RepID=A0A9W9UD84_PENBR|nr:Zinc finger MYND-type [Penicillium brevicompactum]
MPHHSGCADCGNMKGLFRCRGCKVTQYCSTGHKKADYIKHRVTCNRIQKALRKMQARERALRAHEDKPFEHDIGNFWGCPETRPYMRARLEYVNALLANKSFESIKTQLDHCMECLRLCKRDNMGIREQIPSLMICLGKDQECYNFVKWWTFSTWSGERWGEKSIENANPLESSDWYYDIHGSVLPHAVSMTLLNIKLMFVLMSQLEDESDNCGSVIEAMESVRGSSFMKNPKMKNCKNKLAEIEKVKDRIRRLYTFVDKTNSLFWPALVEPDEHLGIIPDGFGIGGKCQMQMTLNYTYDSWDNFKPGIEIIARALKGEMI